MSLILAVEDDQQQAEFLWELLAKHFPDDERVLVESESDFKKLVDSGEVFRAAVVLMDSLLPWNTREFGAGPDGPRHLAGVRCARYLRKAEGADHIPVIFRSIIDDYDLTRELPGLESYWVLGKSPHDDQKLVDVISQQLAK